MAHARRSAGMLGAVLALAMGTAVSQPAEAAPAHADRWSAMRHQFDYQRQPVSVVEHGVETRGGALIHDITYRAPGQDPVDAYLVAPARKGTYAGALFLHWLGDEHADRAQFLDEAVGLASTGHGLVSLLPQLEFPFAFGPIGDQRDKDSVIKQTISLRRGLDLLTSRRDVNDDRIAVVGHDYGGMYASLLGALDRDRVHTAVLIAIDATFGNWFVTFFLDLPPEAEASYRALLASVDPIHYVGHGPGGGILLQFATDDFFILNDVAASVGAATRQPHRVLTYDTDHALDVPAARAGRDAFLRRALHL